MGKQSNRQLTQDSSLDVRTIFGETWESVNGYEDLYEVSSFGRVKTKLRIVKFKDGRIRTQNPKMMSLNKGKYLMIGLNRNGIQRQYNVHRLVATHFVDGRTEDRNQVNHKNGIKYDNRAINLEWCTPTENSQHAIKMGLIPSKKGMVFSKESRKRMVDGQRKYWDNGGVPWNKGLKKKD